MPLPASRISGVALRALARAARNKVGSRAFYELLRADLALSEIESLPASFEGAVEGKAAARAARPPRAAFDAKLGAPRANGWSATSDALVEAYRTGKVTPGVIVTRALAAARELASQSPTMGPLLEYADTDALNDAEASMERYRRGATRGALDGVPFVVKEEIGVRGFRVQGGTVFLDAAKAGADATCVERLRAAGAIVLGTTPMTELGMSPVGFNTHRRMPRNPHDPSRVAGGSSTGSAVAVATGMVPFALGGDGGGSIRIPAAMCGVFGIKGTWGRVSRYGDIYDGSVEHLGPIASSTLDLARCLEAIGAPDPRDPWSASAPKIERGSLVRALGRGVRGLRIGVLEDEWADASVDIVNACKAALRALENEGAVLVPLSSELTRHAASIGVVIMGTDGGSALHAAFRDRPEDFGADLAVTVGAISHVSALDYLKAQRLRSGLRAEVAKLLEGVDLLAFPTTAQTAISMSDAEHESGILDSRALAAYVRYCFLGNLTGLPASSAPVGNDRAGLPIGLQLLGDAWDEATVLAATAHLERIGVARVERPKISVNACVV